MKNKGGRAHKEFSKATLEKASKAPTLVAAAKIMNVCTATARKALKRNKLPVPNLAGLGLSRAVKMGPEPARRYARGEISIPALKKLLKTNQETAYAYLKRFGVTKKGERRCKSRRRSKATS